ncbi:MAG: sulfatase-like hydrolase/transferase [Planctomycetota bacterium]
MNPLRSALTVVFSIAITALATAAHGQERPNLLVIMADDLGYGDLGFTGAPDIKTPRLDALANNGVVFTNGYVTHPYCGPSRLGFITGRYQARFGIDVNFPTAPFDRHIGLPQTETTFATRLQKVGYRTGLIGKWHLGIAAHTHPNRRGFDYFFGFLGGGHDFFPEDVTEMHTLLKPDGTPNVYAGNGYQKALHRNDQVAGFDEYLTTALSRDAAAFVTDGDKPFCLFLSYNAPHTPLQAPQELIDKYQHIENPKRRVYAAMIDSMDSGIGIVVDALEASGKLDNTLIFFLSDNGGVTDAFPWSPNANWARNAPFRSGKVALLEGGVHVPFIAHWPNGLPSGATFDAPVISLDIAATFVAAGGGDTGGKAMDGVNLLPFVNGKTAGVPHEALYWRKYNGDQWAIRTPTAKYLKPTLTPKPELYLLESDPYETTDVADGNPELRAELARMWNAWNAENEAAVYPEAHVYQQMRLDMYDDLNKRLREEAEAKHPVVIE